MMKIWKQVLKVTDSQRLQVPHHAQLLSVQVQNGQPCLWMLCNPANKFTEIMIGMYGTGNPIDGDPGKFLGTFQLDDGALAFHVFDTFGNL